MQFRISHRFPCTAERLWALMRDPAYEAELQRTATVDLTVLSREERDGHLHETFRIVSRKDLPAIAQKAAGVTRMAYEQDLDSNNQDLTIRWRIRTAFMADKIKCSGLTRVLPSGDGCERTAEGDISVNVMFIGGQIEKQVIAEIQSSYDAAAKVLLQLLQTSSESPSSKSPSSKSSV